jgi:hypothetical protein
VTISASRARSWLTVSFGFVLLGFFAWAGFALINLFLHFFSGLEKTVAVAIVAGSVTIVTSATTIALGKYYEGKRQAEAAIRDKKIELYDSFVSKLFTLFGGEGAANDAELAPFLRETQRKLLLWSGPDVLNAYGKWNRSLRTDNKDPKAKVLLEMIEFFLALRQDLGHSNRGVQKEYLVALLLKQPELYMTVIKSDPDVRFSRLVEIEKSAGL